MKIAFFEVKQWEKTYLKKHLKQHELFFYDFPLTEENINLVKNCESIVVFIYSKINKKIISQLPKLKKIITMSTGTDHIDLKYCSAKKIQVLNVPDYGEKTVAEHTFALILSLSRNIHKSYVRTLKNDYSIEGLTGFDLNGKTLGIIGGGHIGMHVAKIAKGFGMNVLVYDLNKQCFLAELLNFKYADFETILKHSDIISLHVPYNKNTHHLINKQTIKLMKKSAILINTSRGPIVDSIALLNALKTKKIGGAGLDVIEGEELIREENELLHSNKKKEVKSLNLLFKDHDIFRMDNVVFTPHNAFNSKEAINRILEKTIENIQN